MSISTLLWFRRDLRLHDHATLVAALKSEGAVQPVFVFDTDILKDFPAKDDRRLMFLAETLARLDAELRKCGGGLLVLHGSARTLIPQAARALGAARVVIAADFEPATRVRDKAVQEDLGAIELVRVKDHLVRAPHEVLKGDGTPYRIYTPYMKAWRAKLTKPDLAERVVEDQGRYADFAKARQALDKAGIVCLHPEKSAAHLLQSIGYTPVDLAGWGVEKGASRLADFAGDGMRRYADSRNAMADEAGVSMLSPYLRFGLLSIREAAKAARDKGGEGSEVWLNELVWRDFFAQVLYHFPETATQEFQPKYRGTLKWAATEAQVEAWKQGRTGYPAVDAAQRQLLELGWIHNRARLITATFFCRHLRGDWRVGEAHFGQYLMDYDLSSNIGNWQWCASTGADAQPYFRVFNPVSQSRKFDAKGDYIRRYVPELEALSDKMIHEPWLLENPPKDYPQPIVDISETRGLAIAMFKQVAAV